MRCALDCALSTDPYWLTDAWRCVCISIMVAEGWLHERHLQQASNRGAQILVLGVDIGFAIQCRSSSLPTFLGEDGPGDLATTGRLDRPAPDRALVKVIDLAAKAAQPRHVALGTSARGLNRGDHIRVEALALG